MTSGAEVKDSRRITILKEEAKNDISIIKKHSYEQPSNQDNIKS
jgi:hypothetical protein